MLTLAACSDEQGGDDNDLSSAIDDDTVDDDAVDDDAIDDDSADDDVIDDDTTDDDTSSDDYIAPWPQGNVEEPDYDESLAAGPLRQKAEEYDQWHLDHHQPLYGGNVGVRFADPERTIPAEYYDFGDSCEWTGLFLGSQATRYYVTRDPQAKANAIAIVHTLDGYLHITETPGFIARYWGKQDPLIYQGDDWCDANGGCHRIETGEHAGDFWWGETSRDMYSGWFFGMSLAYDLIDDEDTRAMIRDDVSEVLNTLLDHKWRIIDEGGQPTDAAPNVTPPFRLSWLTVGYHITGEERIKTELQTWLRNKSRPILRASSLGFFNKYAAYFGNCLSHETWYNLLRLAKVYFNADDYQFLLDMFNDQVHTFTRLSHNPWFNAVYMGQGGYVPGGSRDLYQEQLVQDLTEFFDAPKWRYHLDARDPGTYTLDPLSVFLSDLEDKFPFLITLLGDINPQALDPFPVQQQCSADFNFQWSPFTIDECGDGNPLKVDPGVDYLIPYWLASYHKFVTKDM